MEERKTQAKEQGEGIWRKQLGLTYMGSGCACTSPLHIWEVARVTATWEEEELPFKEPSRLQGADHFGINHIISLSPKVLVNVFAK